VDGIWKLERGGGVGVAGRKRRQRVEVEMGLGDGTGLGCEILLGFLFWVLLLLSGAPVC
jgi:hypothetical protein